MNYGPLHSFFKVTGTRTDFLKGDATGGWSFSLSPLNYILMEAEGTILAHPRNS